jgi:threonine aldolase
VKKFCGKKFLNYRFGSDNTSGVHEEVLNYLSKINSGAQAAYGHDEITKQALTLFEEKFGRNSKVYFFPTGSAANTLGLFTSVKSFQTIITSEHAHIDHGNCGAVEKYIGCKLITLPAPNGKITTKDIEKAFKESKGDPQKNQPSVVSITQPTEYGTVYQLKEMKDLSNCVHELNMKLHVDGARLSNAVVSLNSNFEEISQGVDILSFGGTKSGLMGAESVVLFESSNNNEMEFIRKQSMQTMSKMRFISGQFLSFFENDLWRRNAENSNKMASYLERKLKEISIEVTQEVEANMVFAKFSPDSIMKSKLKYGFKVWNPKNGEVRLVCSFDTKSEEIDEFVQFLKN